MTATSEAEQAILRIIRERNDLRAEVARLRAALSESVDLLAEARNYVPECTGCAEDIDALLAGDDQPARPAGNQP